VFLKAVFGLDMDDEELEIFQRCTGRTQPPIGGVKESYAIVGRRGGKSRIVSVAAAYIATFHNFKKYLSPGERGMVLCLARDREQARIVFNYLNGIFNTVPALSNMVSASRGDEIEVGDVTIAVKAADYRAVRGVTIVCCICDEVCFWDSTGISPDREIFAALRPAMATVPESKLLTISSPYSKYGVVWEAYHDHYGKDDAPILIWKAPTTVMNPLITEQFVQEQIERDPDSAKSEWLANFRDDIESAFSFEAIQQCIIPHREELLPALGLGYCAFVDPSGGRHDQFALAVAHRAHDRAVVDLIRGWRPPFDPSEVISQCAEILKTYRIQSVTGDAYAGEFPREHFRKQGIDYVLSGQYRST
jgi:hypothetical protein